MSRFYRASVPLTLELGFEAEDGQAATEFVKRCVDTMMKVTRRAPWQEDLEPEDAEALLGSGQYSEKSKAQIFEVEDRAEVEEVG